MLYIEATGLYPYPDVIVICSGLQCAKAGKDFVTNPTLVVEVLSPSTEDYDLGKKFSLHYRTMPTLLEYVTIAQDRPEVGLRTRQAEDRWLLTYYTDLAQVVELSSVGCSLPLSEIYDRVEWPKEGA